MKNYYFIFAFLALIVVSCKSKHVPAEDVQVTVAPQNKIEKDTVVVPKQEVILNEQVLPGDKYFLIINSYTIPEFAQAAKKIYIEKGFKPAVVMRDRDGYYRLAIKSFNDYQKAVKEMQRLKGGDPEYKNLWVFAGRNQTESFN